ncbi:DHA2 family efflux MFS transporter permease subunit [Raoultibacter timonensis]|uniref:DHA2 family efflux MFS transporter permease subunit n=1 Tax=Raoultibacter timonensis TaxID=1907662 RepID=UPI001FCC135D|nr:DHA2 family efflux MFS transporter permease subunit [Raoultibacter timonensis]
MASTPMIKGERAQVYALFAIVMLAGAFGNLSQTAVNAMMPGILGEFGVDVGLGQWLTTSYMLVLGVTVPVATFFSRRFSIRQHVFIALGFFCAGSLLDCIAVDFWMLLGGRVLQAVSTGLLMPLMQTIAMTKFPTDRRSTAMGIAGIAMGFAPNIGPTIGGAMIFSFGWRSFFYLLLAAVIVLAAATALCIAAEKPADGAAKLDAVSLMQSTLGFGGLLLAFSNASGFALTSPFIWVPLVLGILFLVLFVRRQNRVDDPLINMGIFKSRQFTSGFMALNFLHASFMGITLVIPLYIEGLCGGTSLDAGIVLLPGTLAALFLNPVAGALVDRIGIRPVVMVSGVLLAFGSIIMVFVDENTPLFVTMLFQAFRAFGVSGLMAPLISWSLADLPRSIVTDGSSFCIAVRQACASLGTSAMVYLITVVSPTAATPALAYQLAFAFSAVFAVLTFAYIVVRVK